MARLLTRVEGVVEQELDGEVLLLPPGSMQVLHLNAVAASLWQAMAPTADVARVADEVGEAYGVPADRVLGDLAPVVAALLEHGMAVEGPARG